jgi:hypothetical protein
MKKLYLFLPLLFIVLLSQAQISKGTIVLGGNLGYTQQNSSSGTSPSNAVKSTDLDINPSFGKAIKDNLVLGFDVTYGNTTLSQDQSFNDKSNDFGAGFFVRKYKPLGNGFYLFGQSRLGGGYSHGRNDGLDGANNPESDISNGFNLSLQFYPGIAYAINRNWQIEMGLPNFFAVTYNRSKETISYIGQPDQISNSNDFEATSTLTGSNNFTIGLRYFVGKQ